MLPTRQETLRLLDEANERNPGPWREHSLAVADCAERIARRCPDMDADKAYIVGALHDIGRRFSKKHLTHVIDGYHYMTELGYDEAARVCMTHSFNIQQLDTYIGDRDASPEDEAEIERFLSAVTYDDYDRLIQLCDSASIAIGVTDMDKRMADVESRYGSYPAAKRERNYALKRYFEQKMGENLYRVVSDDPAMWGK